MKRFFSFMMALAMLFSMSINAFAAEGTGSITITNATVDHVYTLYKIFDASYNADENGNTNGVSYSITTDNQFYSYMFNEDGTAKTDNVYFTYNAVTGAVTLNSSVNSPDAEAAMFAYLKAMVESGNYTPTAAPITATTQEVVFTDLPYGYYLIHKGSDAAVTIDSNTPDVEVIDKTQKPNVFDKQILNDDTNVWTDEISSNVGDREKFKITFTATNYDGEGHIQYYTVKDVNGDALLVDFYRFTVNVGNTAYTKGYYYNISDTTANDYVGTWADEDKDINKADWYIVRTAENAFQIVLPWQESHIFDATPEEGKGYITYTADSASKYASPVEVVIEYFATVEENANIGGVGMNENSNLKNTANLEWTYEGGSGGKGPEVTNIKVYALGV
ncbi:MAG: hypothetical protein IKV63_05970, partial [Clostridia bacterium]|nr:hypothetical protein [Clostridia bacterium]